MISVSSLFINTLSFDLNCLLFVTLTGVIVGGGAVLFSKPLIRLYANDVESIKYGVIKLTIAGSSYFLCGIQDVLVGGLRGLGYSIIPMLVSVIGICGIRILWIETVFVKYHTLEVLTLSYPVSWAITGIVHMICYIIIYKKRVKEMTQEAK